MNALEKDVEGLSFLDKLTLVYEQGELDFWEDRVNLPNLSVDEFDLVLYRIDSVRNLRSILRESTDGPHGVTGEDDCFILTAF